MASANSIVIPADDVDIVRRSSGGRLEEADGGAVVGGRRQVGRVRDRREALDDDPGEAERFVGRSRSRRGRPGGASAAPQMWTETRSVAGSRPISTQRSRMTGSAAFDVVRRKRVEVELVREPGGQPPGDLRSVAADQDRQARLLDTLGLVDRVGDVGVASRRTSPCPGASIRVMISRWSARIASRSGALGKP